MNDDTRWRSLRTVNLHLASPVRSRWWAKLQSDFVPSLGRFGSNLLLQQLILKLDHGWSRLGMFIVEALLVYILHGYCHWSLFGCDLVKGSRELFIADDITCLHCSHRQSRFSCSFVGVGRLVCTWFSSSESLQLQFSCALVGVGVAHLRHLSSRMLLCG